ncbi:hypothetical protein Ait01nite_091240 [Actinoplanes italicus]|uniref:Uncharacterized protein n=1 Tax=Actinoplanes italicus TaxID=113567 RepID=A0A2T0JSD8_9ACTN|nr:hypothetical protein [Actinoplanes italicus]PRX10526.1 hypothetical protein CLV67_1336 [Actinoplanes italicus]GIE36079.1 hypothetical protein Ait01nite_091240 [Actinoplanes italicus]
MTLTAELADPESAAARLLRDLFPARDAISAIWGCEVERLAPVATGLASSSRAAVGGAIEWSIGLSMADTVPYADVFDLVPQEEAARILRGAGLRPNAESPTGSTSLEAWHRPTPWAPAEPDPRLLRDSWTLSQYAGILRRVRTPDPEQWRQSYQLWLTMFGDQMYTPEIEEALKTLWHAYVTRGHAALVALGSPRVVRPVFDDAFAIGDLVVGGVLVDVKAYLDPSPSIGAFVDQLLGYVLCDVDDRFEIQSISVYLAWQGVLLHLPLTTALTLASGQSSFDLMAARQAFQHQIAPAVERSRFYKHGHTAPAPDRDI